MQKNTTNFSLVERLKATEDLKLNERIALGYADETTVQRPRKRWKIL